MKKYFELCFYMERLRYIESRYMEFNLPSEVIDKISNLNIEINHVSGLKKYIKISVRNKILKDNIPEYERICNILYS